MKCPEAKIGTAILSILFFLFFTGSQSARADFIFGEPVNPGAPINTPDADGTVCLSPDGLSLYFGSDRAGGYGMYDMLVATRPTTADGWNTPVNLGQTVNASTDDGCPSLSADGLELYFTSDRSGGCGSFDIWVTTRPSVSDPWGEPVTLGPTVNSSYFDSTPSLSYDGLSLYFGSNRDKAGTAYSHLCYIYVTTRPTRNDPWGLPVRLRSTVNLGLEYDADHPSISADGRVLFFTSNRPGGIGDGWDLWMATRPTADAEWSTAVNLGAPINDSHDDLWPHISPDGSTLFFLSERTGGLGGEDIWQVLIEPIVDFNMDGAVDCLDVCDLVDHWGTSDSLYDIGPTPFGDGVVDIQDLIVLAEHMAAEVDGANDVE
jgi:Tol biopolymer transport system component